MPVTSLARMTYGIRGRRSKKINWKVKKAYRARTRRNKGMYRNPVLKTKHVSFRLSYAETLNPAAGATAFFSVGCDNPSNANGAPPYWDQFALLYKRFKVKSSTMSFNMDSPSLAGNVQVLCFFRSSEQSATVPSYAQFLDQRNHAGTRKLMLPVHNTGKGRYTISNNYVARRDVDRENSITSWRDTDVSNVPDSSWFVMMADVNDPTHNVTAHSGIVTVTYNVVFKDPVDTIHDA